jgi:glutamyl-tRNA synthetase
MTVVTRFAPSPTGILHIGGARTALFNRLFARHHGGRYLLRIEDTDRARSTPEAVDAILTGLDWLGLAPDEEPLFQSSRIDRHAEVARQLLESGRAYRCYCTPEELADMREKARSEGRSVLYDGRWRDRDPADAPPGVAPAIRLKAPRSGETIIDDRVQGAVRIDNRQLDDMVLLRSDGTPTYMLSVVVDDHDMAITHVIRGDDHLNNAARQMQLFQAMDWPIPMFAHIPLIHGEDGAKLSKRHGAVGVAAYREDGFLPEAMRNYLLRLGWSHGDDEIISDEQAAAWFELDQVGRSPARFDRAKLLNLNAHYIQQASDTRLADLITATSPAEDRAVGPDRRQRLIAALPHLKQRAKTVLELIDTAKFITSNRPLDLEPKAAELLKPDARTMLGRLAERLAGASEWSQAILEESVRSFAESENVKLGTVAQPLRAALTGRNTSPGIFDVLVILGREESLARLGDITNDRH